MRKTCWKKFSNVFHFWLINVFCNWLMRWHQSSASIESRGTAFILFISIWFTEFYIRFGKNWNMNSDCITAAAHVVSIYYITAQNHNSSTIESVSVLNMILYYFCIFFCLSYFSLSLSHQTSNIQHFSAIWIYLSFFMNILWDLNSRHLTISNNLLSVTSLIVFLFNQNQRVWKFINWTKDGEFEQI